MQPPPYDAGISPPAPAADPCEGSLGTAPDGYVFREAEGGETTWTIDGKGAAFVLRASKGGSDEIQVGPADGPFHTLYTAPKNVGILSILPDATSIYFITALSSDTYTIAKIARGGGAPTTIYEAAKGTFLGSLVADAANRLLFAEGDPAGTSIKAIPKSGGAPIELVRSENVSASNLRLDAGVLYWVETQRQVVHDESIRSVPLAGGTPALFAHLVLPTYVVQMIVSNGVAFFSREAWEGEEDTPHLYRVERGLSAVHIGSGFGPFLLDGARIYQAQSSGIYGMTTDGGDETRVVATSTSVASLVTTKADVYYALATCIMKTAK